MPGTSDLTAGGASPRERFLTSLLLLWLAGNALRLTVLAVPPVIPLIHDQLNMSATEVGILTGLPSMLLALAAVPGSLLIAKLGVRDYLVKPFKEDQLLEKAGRCVTLVKRPVLQPA